MRKSVRNQAGQSLTVHGYPVRFEPAEEGGYVVTCAALPGLVTEGDSVLEAQAMARDAVRGYLDSLKKDHLPTPPTSAKSAQTP